MSDESLIASLRDRVRTEVGRVLKPGPVALLDFPDYGNPGDSAIWLGALACLAGMGLRPAYTCDQRTFNEQALRRAVPSGTILLTGGGNFGDLWPRHQAFRERVVSAFPDHAIVQLPQTIHFDNPDAIGIARRVLGKHRDLTLLVRDERSLGIAANDLGCRATLCPDLAFALERNAEPALNEPVPPSHARVIRLFRTDHESARTGEPRAATVDWTDDVQSPMDRLGRLFGGHAQIARQRLRRGARLLRSARIVVTDRLHGHVLSLLLGIPHVVFGDRNGKLRTFIDTWTSTSTLLRWTDSAEEADRVAEGLL